MTTVSHSLSFSVSDLRIKVWDLSQESVISSYTGEQTGSDVTVLFFVADHFILRWGINANNSIYIF